MAKESMITDSANNAVHNAWQALPNLKELSLKDLAWLAQEYNTLAATVVRELKDRINECEQEDGNKES